MVSCVGQEQSLKEASMAMNPEMITTFLYQSLAKHYSTGGSSL
jgi:hypothetical protein